MDSQGYERLEKVRARHTKEACPLAPLLHELNPLSIHR